MSKYRKLMALFVITIFSFCMMTACGTERETAETRQQSCFEDQVETVTTDTDANEDNASQDNEDLDIWVRTGNMLPVDEKAVACDLLVSVSQAQAIKEILETTEENGEDKDIIYYLKQVPTDTSQYKVTEINTGSGKANGREGIKAVIKKRVPVALFSEDENWIVVNGISNRHTDFVEIHYLAPNGIHEMDSIQFGELKFNFGYYLEPVETLTSYKSKAGNIPVNSATELVQDMMMLTGNISIFEQTEELSNVTDIKKIADFMEKTEDYKTLIKVEHYEALDLCWHEKKDMLPFGVQNVATGEIFILVDSVENDKVPYWIILGSDGYQSVDWLKFTESATEGVDILLVFN